MTDRRPGTAGSIGLAIGILLGAVAGDAFAGSTPVERGWAATTNGVNQSFEGVVAAAQGRFVYDAAGSPDPEGYPLLSFRFFPAPETEVPDLVCDPLSDCVSESGDGGWFNTSSGDLTLQIRSGSSFLSYSHELDGLYSNNNANGSWVIHTSAEDLIFADGFESGNTFAWSTEVGL